MSVRYVLLRLGGYVYHSRAAQQHAERVRLPLFCRHIRRLPLGAQEGVVASFARSDGPSSLLRGRDLDRRAGQWVHAVHVPRGLRQGPERNCD